MSLKHSGSINNRGKLSPPLTPNISISSSDSSDQLLTISILNLGPFYCPSDRSLGHFNGSYVTHRPTGEYMGTSGPGSLVGQYPTSPRNRLSNVSSEDPLLRRRVRKVQDPRTPGPTRRVRNGIGVSGSDVSQNVRRHVDCTNTRGTSRVVVTSAVGTGVPIILNAFFYFKL